VNSRGKGRTRLSRGGNISKEKGRVQGTVVKERERERGMSTVGGCRRATGEKSSSPISGEKKKEVKRGKKRER